MSLRKTAMSGMAWTFTQQFGSHAITFIVSTVMARILLPTEFGLIGMITVFMAIADSLVNSGLTQSLIRTAKPDQRDYSTVFFFNLTMSIIVYVIIYFCAPLIADFYSEDVLTPIVRIYCISFIINAFSAVQLTKLTKEMQFKVQMMVALPSLFISGILGVVLAYLGFGVWSLVWMGVVRTFLNTAQLWLRSGWVPSLIFDKVKFKEHFKFGSNLAISGLLDTIFQNIYQIVIGRFFSPMQVGFFTRANTLKQLPVANVSETLNKVTYPLFASINDDNERLKRVYRQIMQMVIYVLSPILVFMLVLGEPLFRFLFTEKWLPAVPYFQILCITGILYPIHAYNLSILKIKGRSDLFLRLEVAKKAIIAIAIIISIQYGIMALIWSQLITNFVGFFINSYYSGKFIKYTSWQQLRDILPMIILAFLIGGVVFLVDKYVIGYTSPDIIRLIVGSLAGTGLYVLTSWLLKFNSLGDIKKILLRR